MSVNKLSGHCAARYFDFQLARARKLFLKLASRHLGITITRKQYYGRPIADKERGNKLISDMIVSGKPFMITRLGSVELGCMVGFLSKQILGKQKYEDKIVAAMVNNAGFFPGDEERLDRFCRLMLEDMALIDILGVWNINLEDYLVKEFCNQSASLVTLGAIDPFHVDLPWSSFLENRKVLVIHPYGCSIRNQYQKRSLLYPGTSILPQFDLKVITAVQSIAGTETEFADWFEALGAMQNAIADTDFDIALIGAGAYGLPLAAYVKSLGKQAIHMGGTLQLLFGIMGKRWDTSEHATKYYNEHWTRPLPSETPAGAAKVEKGCYW
ncbi:hypothetical protein [Trichlorobacter ammonificans]|uniref:Uncharacterized protein n=1 Tax=Trichlorobacter ammonificans TaxID=2916410 RepID=A0ABM9D5G6_9BACT|nr:hypothetical protein [Trichlorobacter ammonificans]CAH2030484.1 conserved protein of unknown function [Trichlorobacter ammonificans]